MFGNNKNKHNDRGKFCKRLTAILISETKCPNLPHGWGSLGHRQGSIGTQQKTAASQLAHNKSYMKSTNYTEHVSTLPKRD